MQNIKSLVRTDINFNRVTREKLRNFLNTFQPFELCAPAKVYGLILGMEPKPSQGEILRDYSDRPEYVLIDTVEPLKVFDLGTLNIRNLSIAIGHLAEMGTRENYLADMHHITLKLKPHTKPTRKTDFEVIGLTADTFYWWLKQDRRAGATLQENRCHPKTVCTQLEKYILTYTVGPDNVRVWGNGAAFDNVIVKNHFQKFNIEVPWKFWNDRCARTLFALNPHISRVKPKIAHVAGYDAVAQAETIIAILRENKRILSEVSEND